MTGALLADMVVGFALADGFFEDKDGEEEDTDGMTPLVCIAVGAERFILFGALICAIGPVDAMAWCSCVARVVVTVVRSL